MLASILRGLCVAAAVLLIALLMSPVRADVVGVAEPGDGSAILLDNARTVCVEPALDATYVAADGKRTPGCWIARGDMVLCVFFDTDLARIPMAAVKPPKKI